MRNHTTRSERPACAPCQILAPTLTKKHMLPYRARVRSRSIEEFDGWVRHDGRGYARQEIVDQHVGVELTTLFVKDQFDSAGAADGWAARIVGRPHGTGGRSTSAPRRRR